MAKTAAPVITVTTAQPLNAAQTKEVLSLLARRAGNTAVEFQTDPSILGGIQVKIGGQNFDASLEGTLERLQLSQAACVVTTAVPLTDTQRTTLKAELQQKYGSIAVDEVVDPSVIGGIRVVIGSKEFDRTVAGRLKKLKNLSQKV